MCFLLVKERPGLSRCVKDGPASLGKGHSAEEAVASLASVLPHKEVSGEVPQLAASPPSPGIGSHIVHTIHASAGGQKTAIFTFSNRGSVRKCTA